MSIQTVSDTNLKYLHALEDGTYVIANTSNSTLCFMETSHEDYSGAPSAILPVLLAAKTTGSRVTIRYQDAESISTIGGTAYRLHAVLWER